MNLKFKKLHPNAKLPIYATGGASGMDLHACIEESFIMHPGESAMIPTGLALEMEDNRIAQIDHMEAQIRGRSDLASKGIVAHFGTIDSDYRGEIRVILTNHSRVQFQIDPDMRIAQMVVCASVVRCQPEFVEELNDTKRGSCGFGSTGEKEVTTGHAYSDGYAHMLRCKLTM